jgi:hypothetical protein
VSSSFLTEDDKHQVPRTRRTCRTDKRFSQRSAVGATRHSSATRLTLKRTQTR